MIKPVVRSTLYESVLEQMLTSIERGYWEPGGRMPGESALASKFQVSRNSIREVMKSLAFFGIVEPRPGNGTFLSPNALRNIHNTELVKLISGRSSLIELMEVRLLIEAQAAYWASERATKETIAELEAILREEKLLPEPDVDLHARFHDTIVKLSGNKLLIQLYNSIRAEISIQRKKFKEWPVEELRKFSIEHAQILDRIKNKDPKSARDLMQTHIMDSLWKILENGKEPLSRGLDPRGGLKPLTEETDRPGERLRRSLKKR
jgi:GntR family transcriptional repressor for pyruvate dehydrogenase complex